MTNIDVGEVAMVSPEDIEVGERARQEMGDLSELEISGFPFGFLISAFICSIFVLLKKKKVKTR